VVSLLDACDVLGDGGFPQHVKSLEDAFIGEVETTTAMATVLLDGLFEGTLLGDVSLFVAVVAEAVATSASKKGALHWSSTTWSQGHLIFGGHAYWGVGDVCVSDLF